MPAQATWMPSTEHGEIHNRAELPESVFAFPRQRKEPLTDASHVKNALARFDQVEGVPTPIASLPSPISRRQLNITASNCERAAGANSERAAKAPRVASSKGTGDKPVPSQFAFAGFFLTTAINISRLAILAVAQSGIVLN